MKQYLLLSLVLLVAVFGLSLWLKPEATLGSMGWDTYISKTITSTNASATSPYQIRGGTGTLGSIIVGSSSAAVLRIYDGTTATSSGTLLGSLKAAVGENTYTFDVAVTNGIVLDVPAAFNGAYTITYR